MLERLFRSRTRAQVLRLLFGLNEARLHVRAIERQSGLTVGAVREELEKLRELGLVTGRRDGNRLYYAANREHPLFTDLRSVVLKTDGLHEVLRKPLEGAPIRVAFVFGSLGSGTERARSDVDLMVIGRIGLRGLSRLLAGVSETIGREINAVTMEPGEFRQRQVAADPFVRDVLSKPKLFIIGGPLELDAVA